MANKTHYFYVLWCADETFYGGYTTDLTRREQEHNGLLAGDKGAKYTKLRRPVRLVFAKGFATRSQAMKEEAAFKALSRAKKEQYLSRYGVHLQFGVRIVRFEMW